MSGEEHVAMRQHRDSVVVSKAAMARMADGGGSAANDDDEKGANGGTVSFSQDVDIQAKKLTHKDSIESNMERLEAMASASSGTPHDSSREILGEGGLVSFDSDVTVRPRPGLEHRDSLKMHRENMDDHSMEIDEDDQRRASQDELRQGNMVGFNSDVDIQARSLSHKDSITLTRPQAERTLKKLDSTIEAPEEGQAGQVQFNANVSVAEGGTSASK